MSLSLRYVVSGLVDFPTHVKMVLRECREVPSEELERARVEADLEEEPPLAVAEEQLGKVEFTPEPRTQEEKIIAAFKTQAPEIFESLKDAIPAPPRRHSTGMMSAIAYKPTDIELFLSREQYFRLGSPSLLSIIKLGLWRE